MCSLLASPLSRSRIAIDMYRIWQLFLVLLAGGCGDRDAAAGPIGVPADDELTVGKQLFDVHCARCHGIGGGGGEGPDLRHPVLPSAPDDRALAAVISYGIPGTGMAGAWILTEPEVRQIVSYVRSLGRTEVAELPGEPLVQTIGRRAFARTRSGLKKRTAGKSRSCTGTTGRSFAGRSPCRRRSSPSAARSAG